MKQITLVCLATLSLAACNHSSHQSSATVSSQEMNVSVINGTWYVDYDYREDNCDTGHQQITAVSQDDANDQICSLLENDDANNHCAREKRDAEFNSTCQDFDAASAARDRSRDRARDHKGKPHSSPHSDDISSYYDE